MKVAKPIWLILLAALVLLLALTPSALAGVKADTALINGKIITVDANDSIVQAIAIKDGKVLAIGKTTEIRPFINSKTKVIDLHGRTATPGMIDSHNHWSGTAALFVPDLGPLNCTNVADIQAVVEAQCAIVGAGNWVQGRNWGAAYLDERRPLYASDLDPVSPNNPVFLRETSGHQGVANSVAMQIAGIVPGAPILSDPAYLGLIDLDANGNPTGLLKESATGLVSRYIPPFTEAQQMEGQRYINKYANSMGLTSILVPSGSATSWNRYKAIKDEGSQSVRLGMLWSSGRTVAATQTLIDQVKSITHPAAKDDDMLWPQGIKIVWGGVQDASTHWSYSPHWPSYYQPPTEPYFYGPEGMWDKNVVREQIKLYHDAGLQVQVHCCGDREQDWILESYKLAQDANPTYGLRHGIIHADIPTDWALENMPLWQKSLDYGYTYTNPTFMWWTEIIANSMGPFMSLREMPMKTYLETGNLFGFGSDYNVDPMEPKYSIWAAITRDTLMGAFGPHPFGLDQCIGVRDSLRAMTASNAYLLFMEDKIGSLEVGKYADIAVWDKDWYNATPDEIYNENCEMTLLGGKIVYKADTTPVTVATGL